MADGRRRTPRPTRSECCAARRALRAALTLAALALLLAAGCEQSASEAPSEAAINSRVAPLCGYSREFEEHQQRHFLHWSSGVPHLVFAVDDTMWTLNIEDGRLVEVADVTGNGNRLPYGFHADVSPDGSRIVYSTCEYRLDELLSRYSDYADGMDYTYRYEIAMVNVDGTGRKRLTESEHFDGFPAWSPDGTRVAFVATRSNYRMQHAVMTVATGAVQWLGTTGFLDIDPPGDRIVPYPPAWSPDGRRLAFIKTEGEGRPYDRILYAIGVDGTGLIKIGNTTAPPVWSPEGGELAFAGIEEEEAILYAVRPDGTGRRIIWRSGLDEASSAIFQVDWSPDGQELLFVADRAYVVGADGSGLRPLTDDLPMDGRAIQVAWSPDGSRVAIYHPGNRYAPDISDISDPTILLATVSSDGTDLRTLVGGTGMVYPDCWTRLNHRGPPIWKLVQWARLYQSRMQPPVSLRTARCC